MAVFNLELGVLEYLLAVPGVWFGVPITSMLWLPTVLAMVHEPTIALPFAPTLAGASTWFLLVILPLFTVLMVWYVMCLRDGDHHPFYTSKPLVPGLVCILLSTYMCSSKGNGVPAFYITSYMFTQTFIFIGKIKGQRMRPGAAHPRLERDISRLIPTINYGGAKGQNVFQAFPSGDAAGAMCFSYTLYLITNDSWSFMWVVLSMFGRMYLWAHHLVDVVVGALISVVCMTFLLTYVNTSMDNYGGIHVALSLGLFVTAYKKVTPPPLPTHFTPEGHHEAGPQQKW